MDSIPMTRRLSDWMRLGAQRAAQHQIEQCSDGLVERRDNQVVSLCAFGMAAWAATGHLPVWCGTDAAVTSIQPYLTGAPDLDALGRRVRQICRRNDREHQTPAEIADWLQQEGW